MALQIVGTSVRQGEEEIEPGISQHTHGVKAAQKRAEDGSTPSSSVDSTVFAEIALDFKGAEQVFDVPGGAKAKEQALKVAADEGASGGELLALSNKTELAHAEAAARPALVKRMDRPLRMANGGQFKDGDYFGRYTTGDEAVFAVTADDYGKRFKKNLARLSPAPTAPSKPSPSGNE